MRFWYHSFLACGASAIWPAPQSFSHGESNVWIDESMKVVYNERNIQWSSHATSSILPSFVRNDIEDFLGTYFRSESNKAAAADLSDFALVAAAISRTHSVIFNENFVPWKFHPRNNISQFEPPTRLHNTVLIRILNITQSGGVDAAAGRALTGEMDEAYTLHIDGDGSASISAKSAIGVLHALQTFNQVFYKHSLIDGIYCPLVPVSVIDSPKFRHRGLNMDVSRAWYPKADILRTIDGLAYNKFNRLHLHMTDAQSWPLEIPTIPELSTQGAYMTNLIYSAEDLKSIQEYAALRGVEAYIEFDMPGHTSSIAYSHPELITAFDAQPWNKYCAEPPCGCLKLNSTQVASFLERLFNDVLPRVAPYSSYLHTGGDEVNVNAYLLDDTVQSNLTSVLRPLMQKFVDRNHDQIRGSRMIPVVWEEMLLDWNLKVGSDVVVQTWLSEDSLAQVTARGHKALFGNFNFWYLDCGKGQWLDSTNSASHQESYSFTDYCSPTKNWRHMYSYDPTAHLNSTQMALVVGGEVHIWSEQTDSVNLDDMIWPRASAAGEVLWSGRQDSNGRNRSQLDASPRLAEIRERLVARGIRAGPVQMVFCTQTGSMECSL